MARSNLRLSVVLRPMASEPAVHKHSASDKRLSLHRASRLVEVLLIKALRAMPGESAPPELLRGLADPRLAPAIRQMHNHIARP